MKRTFRNGAIRPRATKPRLRVAILILVAGVAAAVGAWHFSWTARVRAALPAMPEAGDRPELFVQLLTRAEALTHSRATLLEGVAGLGRLYHANGYSVEAEACWRLLEEEEPGEARWCYYLADLSRTASDYAELVARLEKTLDLAPDYGPAWLQLAGLRFKNGELDAAEGAYRRRLGMMPGDPHARLGLARVMLQRNRPAEARDMIEGLVRDAPDFPPGHNLLAEMLAAGGDEERARRHRWLGREAGRVGEAADPWLNELNNWCYEPKRLQMLGTAEFQSRRGDRGLALMTRAVELAPTDPDGYAILAHLYLQLGDVERARKVLERGIRMVDAPAPAAALYINLSHIHCTTGRPEEGLRVARAGLDRAGDSYELRDAVGVALAAMGRHEEAIAAFREAIKRNPDDPNTNFNLGFSLLQTDRRDEAMDALRHSLTLQPTFPKSLDLLGRLEMEAGNLDEAERHLRPLFESNPENPDVRQLLAAWELLAGAAASAAGDARAAEAHYRAGLGLQPDSAELNASLGVLCLEQARFDEALRPLELFHQQQPANAQSALFLGQVYAQLGRVDEARSILAEGARIADAAGRTSTLENCRALLQRLDAQTADSR